jgi:transposase InsO family protein
LEKTARVFLVDLQTLMIWMRRLGECGERTLIQTVEPVNRYPDFVRNLVRQLKCLFPEMGSERMAQILARAGLCLAATTIRRIERENESPPDDFVEDRAGRRRRVVGRYPGHTWHVDLTTVPTRAGFRVPWFPYSIPLAWPFCWWVAVAVDQVSRAFVGSAVFFQRPSSDKLQRFLDRAIRNQGSAPRYIVTDKEKMFRSRSYRRWCKRRNIRPRYGRLGQPASIPIVERFIRSLKQECTRRLLVPLSLGAMRREIDLYANWYSGHRPHMVLGGRVPREVYESRPKKRRRLEPRLKWPHGPRRRDRFQLAVSYVGKRKHLPIIELRRAA